MPVLSWSFARVLGWCSVCVLASALPLSAAVPYWNWRNPLPQGNDFQAATYGDGRFVAVGAGGAVVTSTDGKTWAQAYASERGPIRDVAYGNGRFVALVGNASTLTLVSDDGVVWQSIPRPDTGTNEWLKPTSISFAAGKFWLMSQNLQFVVTSDDGVSWVRNEAASAVNATRIAEADGVLIAYDSSTGILGSSTGSTWTFDAVRMLRSTDSGASWQVAGSTELAAISAGPVKVNGRWLIAGTHYTGSSFSRAIFTSADDGQTWFFRSSEASSSAGNAPIYDFEVWGDRAYLLGLQDRLVSSTTDGSSLRADWQDSSGPPLQVNDLAAGDDVMVAVGRYGLMAWTADGSSWTTVNRSAVTGNLRAAAWGAGVWIVAGETGLVVSSDGRNWLKIPGISGDSTGGAVAYGNGRFVASSGGNRIVVSTDGGESWVGNTSFEASLSQVVFGNGVFVGSVNPRNADAGIHVSVDGVTWTAASGLNDLSLRRLEYIDGLFYAVGAKRSDETGLILRSADGLSWTVVATASNTVMAIAGFKDRKVAATIQGDVLVSTFGAGWQPTGNRPLAAYGPPASFEAVGNQFVGVTYFGRVVVSSDGETWDAEDFSGVGMIFELEQGNGQLLAVGNGGLIWESGTARFTNNSARSHVGAADSLLIAGFVVSGNEPQRMLLRAAGPALSALQVEGALQHPLLQLFSSGGTILGYNAGWSTHETAAEVATATAQVGAFAFAENSADSAMVFDLQPGAYSAMVSGLAGETGVALVEIYAIAGDESHLVNISTRTRVGTGDSILITGFVVGGDAPKQILVRGIGPTLTNFDVSDALSHPVLKVLQGESVLASNEGWGTAANANEVRDVSARMGAFALDEGSADAALLLTLAPGVYTVHVAGADGGTGVALAEVYEVR